MWLWVSGISREGSCVLILVVDKCLYCALQLWVFIIIFITIGFLKKFFFLHPRHEEARDLVLSKRHHVEFLLWLRVALFTSKWLLLKG